MSGNNKVIWSKGMVLYPQHFQQHERYMENVINSRSLCFGPCSWGFFDLKIDTNLLKVGKLAIKSCSGLFPDGTPFNLPEEDDLPLPLDIPDDIQNEVIYLCLALRRPEAPEFDTASDPDGLTRFRLSEDEIKDNNQQGKIKVPVQVGKLKTRVLREKEERSGYTCLGIARVTEIRADKNIIIDDRFIPANVNSISNSLLHGFVNELNGLLVTRSKALAGRAVSSDISGVAEIEDFLLLQTINRYQPLLEHFTRLTNLHPEFLYRTLIQMAGELATFFRDNKRPIDFPVYNHDDLQASFFPMMEELRHLLSEFDPHRRAVQIPLSGPKFNAYAAKRPDADLLKNAVFVLAVRADMPAEELRRNFPQQTIIGPIEEISQYIRSLTRGIELSPMPTVPRQIPYYAGFTYFELDKHCETWKKMATSGAFTIHIDGNYPGLKLEFWAIHEQ